MSLIAKANFTFLAIVCMTKVISAQTVNKNAWMLGGTLGFNSIKTEGNDTSEI